MEWEREGARETLCFALGAKTGPRNGKMREFFDVCETEASRPPSLRPAPPQEPVRVAPIRTDLRRPETSLSQFGGRQPPAGLCLHDIAVACDCDPKLHRSIFPVGNLSAQACLRCGTVTVTESVGDDGRYTGDAWQAYWTVDATQPVVDWLGLWPRVRVDYSSAPHRWPMSADLVRYQQLFYPARTRCENADQLDRLESLLTARQLRMTVAETLRSIECPTSPPPHALPEAFRCFANLWDALQLRPDSELSRLMALAQLDSQASPVATELLLRRPDAFDLIVQALSSDDPVWQSAGVAMSRQASPPDPRLAGVLIDLMSSLPLTPLADVPGRVVSCGRFEALLVVIADLKLATPEIIATLVELERRLAELPQDREIVAYCRGPYCVLAVEAVEMLRGRGYVAFRLEDGVADWQARGLPVVADERETGRRD